MIKEHLGFLTISALGVLICGVVTIGWLYKSDDSTLMVKKDRLSDFELAQYYFSHGPNGEYDLDKARYYYSQVILDDNVGSAINQSETQMAWYQLGRIDFLEGRFDVAIHKFNQLVDLFGDPMPSAHYMLGLTYGYKAKTYGNAEDWSLAESEFQTYLEQNPLSPWARTDLAWIYFAQGKFEEMIPILEKGLEAQPDSPWLLNMYGLALLNTGEKEKAESFFEQAKQAAEPLTVADWGAAYPGNDARTWGYNLETFKQVIDQNLELSRK